ncbi:MAG: hypothetical protein ABIO44_09710 [Saprospiraceae bacterium]
MQNRIVSFLIILSIFYSSKSRSQAFTNSLCHDKNHSDLKILENIYIEKQNSTFGLSYSSYHTFIPEFIYGISSNLNIGIQLRLRTVYRSDTYEPSKIFQFKNSFTSSNYYQRYGLSGMEFIIRYPVKWFNYNFTMQHQIGIPLGKDLEGSAKKGYIDWNHFIIHNQIMTTFNLNKFQIYSEVGLRVENLSLDILDPFSSKNNYFCYLGFPISILPVYSLHPQHHIYCLFQINPRIAFSSDSKNYYDPYYQLGFGYKFFFSKSYEIELITTRFITNDKNKTAYTFNLGIRKYWGRSIY